MHVLLTTGRQHIDHDIVLVDARMGLDLYTSSWPEGAAFRPAHGSSTAHAHLFYDFWFWFLKLSLRNAVKK